VRTLAVITIALSLLAAGACKRPRHINPAATIEEPGELASRVNLADPNAGSQILHGFYGVEAGSWRWSMKRFAVSLQPPLEAARRGARLEMKFAAPDAVWQKIGPLSVQASVAGTPLAPVRITHPGDQSLRVDVPPGVLGADPVIVEFTLDKSFRASENDARELGLIVSEIGFDSETPSPKR
jgi:hypothetical protein